MLDISDRLYEVTYVDKDGQDSIRGKLLSLDECGFVVIEKEGKYILVPKSRIRKIQEVK